MPTKKTGSTKPESKVKKSPMQKVAPKKSAGKRALAHAMGEGCFWTTNGMILSNLVDLRNALQDMSGDVYAHHVTKEKNDFADWIEHVLADGELAAVLRKAKNPQTAYTVVVRRLKVYDV